MATNSDRSNQVTNTPAKNTSYKNILAHSSVYMLGIMLSKAVGFLMLPIYTRYLVPADYGIIELLMLTIDIISYFIGMGLANSALRFYYDYDNEQDSNEVISTALIFGLSASLVGFGSLIFFSDTAANLILGSSEYSKYFTTVFIGMMFFSGIELPLIFLRAQQKSVKFVTVNLVRLGLQLSLNILFVIILEMGVMGVLLASASSSIIISFYLIVVTFRETGVRFSMHKLNQMVKFGYPLILDNLGAFIITYTDRYFLMAYSSLTEVGLYSLGYKFGMLVMMLLLYPFHQYWSAEMFAVAKRDDAQKVFKDFFTYSTFTSILFCLGISIYVREVIVLMSAEAYWSAYVVVPVICLAYILSGMYRFVLCGILIEKKTKYLAYATVLAMLVSLAMNFVLVPRYGAMGASISVCSAFFVRFLATYIISQRIFPIRYEWSRLLVALVFAAGLLVIALNIKMDSMALTLILKTVVFLAYPAVLFLFGWFRPREKELIINTLRHPKRILSAARNLTGRK